MVDNLHGICLIKLSLRHSANALDMMRAILKIEAVYMLFNPLPIEGEWIRMITKNVERL